ncbi:MAG: ABC transporter permease, partial [Verrucomicrobia bacterium]|nr:ABC transporter permease [Verrucomicrobiota bacterium]
MANKIRLPFAYFLAFRYLRPKRTFLSLITLISVLGVVLGISVLIIVISVMTGFERELQKKIIGFDASIIVRSNEIIRDWRPLLARIEKTSGVIAAAPFAQGQAIVQFQDRRSAPWLRGIAPELENKVVNLGQFIVAGELDLSGDTCVVGSELAGNLGCTVGDTIQVYSPRNLSRIQQNLEKAEGNPDNKEFIQKARELILPADVTVTGIFFSGRYA